MMSRMLRKDTIFEKLSNTKSNIEFKSRDSLDLTKLQQLPSYHYVYEKYFTTNSQLPKTKPNKHNIVINQLTNKLRYIQIFMNIPPQTFQGVKGKISKIINKYKELKKSFVDKRGPKWRDTFQNIYDQLDHGFDILVINLNVRNSIQTKYGVA